MIAIEARETDITATIRFDLRPAYEELIRPVDDAENARVWREMALLALGQLHRLTNQNRELQARLRQALDARRGRQ